jgi:hypothetical protein
VRLSYNAGLESPSAKGTVFWLVNSGSSASCTPFSWQRTRRVRPDQAVTAVELARLEICSKNSTALVELALAIGHAAFDAAISSYPDQRFTLWNGILVTREHAPSVD